MSAPLKHRLTNAARLRYVLADGKYHLSTELVAKVGHRFGGALHIISRGDDGGTPWLVERKPVNASHSLWTYRYVRDLAPEEVPQPKGTRAEVARLNKLVAELQRESASLKAALTRALTQQGAA